MSNKVQESVPFSSSRSNVVTDRDFAGLIKQLDSTFKSYGYRLNRVAPLDGSESFTVFNVGEGTDIASHLSATGALDFGSTAAQSSTDLPITVTGAVDGDTVVLGVPNASITTDSCFTAWVSATNTVTVRFNNYSSGALDPASGTFRVDVWQH